MKGNFIAGEWVANGYDSVNINPSDTNDIIGTYAEASREDAEQAIAAAHAGSSLRPTISSLFLRPPRTATALGGTLRGKATM